MAELTPAKPGGGEAVAQEVGWQQTPLNAHSPDAPGVPITELGQQFPGAVLLSRPPAL